MKSNRYKDALLIKKIKAEDLVELPMDEKFFEDMHDKIMQAVEKVEMKPPSKWDKTWVFLERHSIGQKALAKKIIKTSVIGITMGVGLFMLGLSANIYTKIYQEQRLSNKGHILNEVQKNPEEWSQLAGVYQDENDFYADVLSQKNDLATIVEINRAMTQSL